MITTLSLHVGSVNKEIRPGKLSGRVAQSPKGGSIGFTNFYMTLNGVPFIPVVGEFHFSRFSYLHWEEELLKMKAGGVHIIATYVFWIYHEEEEGVFDWSGNRNLRHFIDLCAKHDLPVILRIGPFCHGEVRNGGIPDWVFSKPLEIRSNDPLYLFYAKRLYREIAKQIKGLLFQEGGPVIAVQLENEFMHAGAPFDAWGYKSGKYISVGRGGNDHLDELRRLAEEANIRPAFFTATAWGGAAVPERDTLPMLAGYAYTPWIPNQPPSKEYIFRDLHSNSSEPVRYDTLEYPVAYCEMAGGMQVSYSARPYVSPESVEAMTLVKLASGSNLLGYYMYHGGSNPEGKRGYLNESGLPKITYDYQSPLGEFGRVGQSYDMIRTISLFLDTYGSLLAPMGTLLPEGQDAIAPEDTKTVRWCVRQRDGSGFLFMNNFQDHVTMPDREGLRFEIHTAKGTASFPYKGTLTLKKDACAILPFHLNLSGAELISATVQPLTKLDANGQPVYVFYAHEGMTPEIVLHKRSVAEVESDSGWEEDGNVLILRPAVGKRHLITLKLAGGNTVRMLVLQREEALKTYRFRLWGEDRLVIGDSHLYVKDEQLICTMPVQPKFAVSLYPALHGKLQTNRGTMSERENGIFHTLELELPDYAPNIQVQYPSECSALLKIEPHWPEHVEDVFLKVEYDGDVACAFLGNRLLTDHIHYGKPWQIGLKQFRDELENRELLLSITPLRKGTVHAFVNQAYVERFEGIEIAKFHGIRAVPHFVAAISRAFS